MIAMRGSEFSVITAGYAGSDRVLGSWPGDTLLSEVLRSRWSACREDRLLQLGESCPLQSWQASVQYHGLAGVLLRDYVDVVDRLLPRNFGRIVREIQMVNALAALSRIKVLQDVDNAFSVASIPWIALKGLALSQILYGDIAARGVGDLDVLVSRNDVFRAAEALESIGLKRSCWSLDSKASFRIAERAIHHAEFVSNSGLLVELHWRTDPSPTLSLPDLAKYWPRTERIMIGPLKIAVLPEAVHVGYVATHAARSLCECWKWGYDVLEMLSQRQRGASPFAVRSGNCGEFNNHLLGVAVMMMANTLDLPQSTDRGWRRIMRVGVRARRDLSARRYWKFKERTSLWSEMLFRLRIHEFTLLLESGLNDRLSYLRRAFFACRPDAMPTWMRNVSWLAPLVRFTRVFTMKKNRR